MDSKEFSASIGKEQYTRNQKAVIRAIRQLANALGKDQAYCNSKDFFRDFMESFWEPFEEISSAGNQKQKMLNEEIKAYRSLVEAKVSPEVSELLGHYIDLLGSRNGEALDYAFLVGYQSAFRLILLGLSEPSTVLPNGIS